MRILLYTHQLLFFPRCLQSLVLNTRQIIAECQQLEELMLESFLLKQSPYVDALLARQISYRRYPPEWCAQ